MEPLKIGLCLDPNRTLTDYETQLFTRIFNDVRYEVPCIIKNGNKNKSKLPILNKFRDARLAGTFFSPLLYWFLDFIETKLLDKKSSISIDSTETVSQISSLPHIDMFPAYNGQSYVFTKPDCAKIESFNLDIMLDHEFYLIQGEILQVPKHGIWYLQSGENKSKRGCPAGFWEVYQNSHVTGVSLQRSCTTIDDQPVIAEGFFNTEHFWYFNAEKALDCSIDLVEKHLRLLHEGQYPEISSSEIYSNKNFQFPNLLQTSNYMIRKYSSIAYRELIKRIFDKVNHNSSREVWKIHIGSGKIENAILWQTKAIEPPADEFWADPFLFEFQGKPYVFFENWEYAKEKGKISVGVIKNDQIIDVRDCLDLDYHLSYPFVFKYQNQIFMIPETGEKKRLEIWKCDQFPDKWSLLKTHFEDEHRSLVDSTITKDINGQYWLFVNFGSRRFQEHGSNLCVFQIDSPMMNKIVPHKLNPVVNDCRSARNAGNIYIDHKNRLIRPSQVSQSGIYGKCFNLCHIKKLTLDSYEEEILDTVTPDFKEGMLATHHVSQACGIFVIDGCYRTR